MPNELIFTVDDDPQIRSLLKIWLEEKGYRVADFENGEDCLKALEDDPIAIVLDLMMPGIGGLETLEGIQKVDRDIPVIMATSIDNAETAVKAIKMGAYDYIVKPFDETRLLTTLDKSIEQFSLKRKIHRLEEELRQSANPQGIIGKSKALDGLLAKTRKVENSKASVLILGESGTGKELIARAIHRNSPYSKGLFVDINCGAIPETLQESELFGHKKGAFTGAMDSRIGKLELANNGTLFLDEVAEMNLDTQAKLLRFLQERNFERVGDNQKILVDTRVIAATNKDLKNEVEGGRFREDLYYRLAVFPIEIPPLRSRVEDIPLLCLHFLEKYREELNKEILSFTPGAMAALKSYQWPGNIRQLENAIYQATIINETGTIDLDCLPDEVFQENIPIIVSSPKSSIVKNSDKTILEAFSGKEKSPIIPYESVLEQTLKNALAVTDGNVLQAAKELGLGKSTVYRMLKKYNLQ
jgi:DNA-binding NtrC family response regulator